MITILAPDGVYATLEENDYGISVMVFRDATGNSDIKMRRLIHAATLDAPFHMALDWVHDALHNKGEVK